tara:strand:- start:12175 stop:12486 length:312 start_codon:yes stop_codon:yes gene_type:complete
MYMKNIKKARILMMLSWLVFITTNFYFGWNAKPMTNEEEYADFVVNALLAIGVIFYFIPLLGIYEKLVKDLEVKKDLDLCKPFHSTDFTGKCFNCGKQIFNKN